MGYRCTIKSTIKDIDKNDIQNIVDNLPEKYFGPFGMTFGKIIKQVWGYGLVLSIF